jgi:hypothetical protein
MSFELEYDTTLDALIKDLQKLRKELGGKARVRLPRPGRYDPHFEGMNSKLTAVARLDEVVIVEKDKR